MTLLFRRETLRDELQLERLVIENVDALEPDLAQLSGRLPTEAGAISALCSGSDGKLWIVIVALESDDGLLARALAASAWAKRTLPAVSAIAGGEDLTSTSGVRVAVVSAAYSQAMLAAVEALSAPSVYLYEYRYMRAGDVVGMTIERVEGGGRPAEVRPAPSQPPPAQRPPQRPKPAPPTRAPVAPGPALRETTSPAARVEEAPRPPSEPPAVSEAAPLEEPAPAPAAPPVEAAAEPAAPAAPAAPIARSVTIEPEPMEERAPEPAPEPAPAPRPALPRAEAAPALAPAAAPPSEPAPQHDSARPLIELTDEEVGEFMEFADQLRALSRSRPTYLR